MTRLRSSFIPALAVAAVAMPHDAHAQLLKRIGRSVIERAAAGSTPTGSAPTGTTPGSAASVTAPTAPARVEITPDRLDSLVTSLHPLTLVLERRAAHRRAEQRRVDFDACSSRLLAAPPVPTPAAIAAIDRLSTTMQRMVEEMLDASRRGDTTASRRLTDSSVALSDRVKALTNPAIPRECGTRPSKIAAPEPKEFADAATAVSGAGGMTRTQVGLMRERIGLHLLAPTAPNDLSADERAAIDARRGQLAPLLALMRDGAMEWRRWDDLSR